MPDPDPENVCMTGRFIFRRDFSDEPISPLETVSGPWASEMEMSSNGRSTGKADSSSSSNQISDPGGKYSMKTFENIKES